MRFHAGLVASSAERFGHISSLELLMVGPRFVVVSKVKSAFTICAPIEAPVSRNSEPNPTMAIFGNIQGIGMIYGVAEKPALKMEGYGGSAAI